MKNTIITRSIAALIFVFALAFTAAAQTTSNAGGHLTRAVEMMKQENYTEAEKSARQAVVAYPQMGEAHALLGFALGGLGRFSEAVKSFTKSLELLPADSDGREDIEAALETAKAELAKSGEPNERQNTETAKETAAVKRSGATPQSGLWRAKITNVEREETITFRVSANGKQIEDVVFDGFWRCDDAMSSFKKGLLKKVDVNTPPGVFAISNGAFSDIKKEPYLAWTFEGAFTGGTTARGTFRIEYSTECDTYKLEWTATRAAAPGR
jgi:hypothetical protein